MKVVILGGSGMLGHKLWHVFRDRFDSWVTLSSNYAMYTRYSLFDPEHTVSRVNVLNFDSVVKTLETLRPDVAVNAVGIVKRSLAARDPIVSLRVNSFFPRRLAQLCGTMKIRLIHISTDCVFCGCKGMYREDDSPDPTDLYGFSKLLGEVNGSGVLTLRTSIIGRELATINGLVEWFLSKRGGRVKGYTNAIYSGFPTLMFAQIIADIIEHYPELSGLYHVSSNPISKYELLTLLRRFYKVSVEIDPYPDFRCDRSLDSTRFREVANFKPQTWTEMIKDMKADPTPYDKWRE